MTEKAQNDNLPVNIFLPKFFSALITYMSIIPAIFNGIRRNNILADLSGAPPNEFQSQLCLTIYHTTHDKTLEWS